MRLMRDRLRCVLPGLWAGGLLCIAAIAAPAVFASLQSSDAGRVVSRIFVREAWLSLAFGVVLLGLGRGRHPAAGGAAARRSERALLWGAIGCTLLGYFAVQPLMGAAREGGGMLGFGALHLISTVFYGTKTALVLWLAWCVAAGQPSRPPSS